MPMGETSKTVRVWLLGGFRVSVGSRSIPQQSWRLRKAATLVKLLALAADHRLHREQVMDILWAQSGRRAASNNLRQALHTARNVLDPAMGARYLASEGESLVLCPKGGLWVDVEAFEEAVATAQHAKEPATYRAAIELYSGVLLPEDRYEEWAADRRRALREAHTGLMRLYALSGRKVDALRQYELFEGTISQQLGTVPSASTRALKEEVASGRFPPEAARSPSLRSKEASELPQHDLPVPRTSFVGRGRELTEIKRTLAMTRLLTLTGTGGSGKTRLALKVAKDLTGAYPDGVRLIELAGLSAPELVPQEVADTLGVREEPGRPLVEILAQSIHEKTLLLVTDNCEHLIDAAARLVDFLLAAGPHLKVMATSREPLGVEGEVLFSVPPLLVPSELPSNSRLWSLARASHPWVGCDRPARSRSGDGAIPGNLRSIPEEGGQGRDHESTGVGRAHSPDQG